MRITIPFDASMSVQNALREIESELQKLTSGNISLSGRRIVGAGRSILDSDYVTRGELSELQSASSNPASTNTAVYTPVVQQFVIVSTTQPGSASEGMFWLNPSTGSICLFYNGAWNTIGGDINIDSATAVVTFETFTHVKTGAASSGFGGNLLFRFDNSASATVSAGALQFEWQDSTAGAEYALFRLQMAKAGSLYDAVVINPGLLASENFTVNAYNCAHGILISRGEAKEVHLSFVNNSTGTSMTDGLDVGISDAGVAFVKQRENLALEFYTNNTLRGSFASTGPLSLTEDLLLSSGKVLKINGVQVVADQQITYAAAAAAAGTNTSAGWGFVSSAEMTAFIAAVNAIKDTANAARAALRAHGLVA